MHKSILVLEESTMVHDLFESALPREYWDWHIEHESVPEKYVARAKETQPGIIFLSNQDQKTDYVTVREIRSSSQTRHIPILLLTVARDRLDEKQLRKLGIQGFLRKPFESATLLEQINATVQNHSRQFEKDSRNVLESVDVVDEELKGLLKGKPEAAIYREDLEEELDPTLQLHPIETESMLLDDEASLEDLDEPAMAAEAGEEELLGEEDDFPDFDETETELTGELSDFEREQAETEAIELELEEISLDIDEYEPDEIISTSESDPLADRDRFEQDIAEPGIRQIPVFFESSAADSDAVRNQSDDNEIGLMEIRVIPHESDAGSSESFETEEMEIGAISDSAETDTRMLTQLQVVSPSSADLSQPRNGSPVENIAGSDEAGLPFMDLEVVPCDADDMIEIEHAEIKDDLDDDFGAEYREEIDDTELLEISVEGIDETVEDDFGGAAGIDEDIAGIDEDADDSDAISGDILEEEKIDEFELSDQDLESSIEEPDPEDLVVPNAADEEAVEEEDLQEIESIDELEAAPTDDTEATIVEQDASENLEFDFEAEDTSSDEDDTAIDESLMLDGLEDLDPAGAQMNIQEMINFRQVMKAKYDIPETTRDDIADTSDAEFDFDEDLEIDYLSDDEIEDFHLADEDEDDAEDLLDDSEFMMDELDEDDAEDLPDDSELMMDELDEDDAEDLPDDSELMMDELDEDDAEDLPDDSELMMDELDEDDAEDLPDDSELMMDELDEDDAEDLLDDSELMMDELDEDDAEDLPDDSELMMDELDEDDADETGSDIDDIDIFAEVDDDEISDVDLFADDDSDDDSAIEDSNGTLFDEAETEDSNGTLFDEAEMEDSGETLFDEAEMEDSGETLFDEAEIEDSGDALFDDAGDELLDDADITDTEDALFDDTGLTDDDFEDDVEPALEEPAALAAEVEGDSDSIDLLSDDLGLEESSAPAAPPEDAGQDEPDAADAEFDETDAIFDNDMADEDLLIEEEDDDGDQSLMAASDEDLLLDEETVDDTTFEEIELSSPEALDDDSSEDIEEERLTAGESEQADLEAISEADDLAIEVPHDVFEIGDMKMTDIADNLEADAEVEDVDMSLDEPEKTEDIDLPSMDEDLPDLPSVFDDEDVDSSDRGLDEEEESAEPEAVGAGIEILQSEDDFDSFPDESETIGFEDASSTQASPGEAAAEPVEIAPKGTGKRADGQKKGRTLSPELRDKLSGMIETAISETIQSTLHDMLPEMMDQIIQDELED